jgi:hypothetical protein
MRRLRHFGQRLDELILGIVQVFQLFDIDIVKRGNFGHGSLI